MQQPQFEKFHFLCAERKEWGLHCVSALQCAADFAKPLPLKITVTMYHTLTMGQTQNSALPLHCLSKLILL